MKKVAIFVIFAFLGAVFVALDDQPVDMLTRVISLAVIAIFIWLAVGRRSSPDRSIYPLVSLTILYHLLAFVWPSFRGNLDPRFDFGPEIDRVAILAVSLGLAAFLTGAHMCQAAHSGAAIKFRNLIASNSIAGIDRWFALGLILWLVQFAGNSFLSDVVQFSAVFNLFESFGLSLLLASVFRGGVHPSKAITAYLIFGYEIAVGVAGGMLAVPVFLFVQYFAIRIYFRRGFSVANWTLAALALVAVFALQQVKSEYRQQYWAGESGSTVAERSIAFISLATSALSAPSFSEGLHLTGSFESRVDNYVTIKTVLAMSPEIVPYRLGETFLPLLYTWIPRLLWVEKPQAQLGNSWAKEYELLDSADLATSFNLPWLVEFYVNFGFFGVFFGMLISGYLFRWLEKVFFAEGSPPYAYIVGVALVAKFWWLESNVSLMLGNLVTQVAVIAFLSIAFRQFLKLGRNVR